MRPGPKRSSGARETPRAAPIYTGRGGELGSKTLNRSVVFCPVTLMRNLSVAAFAHPRALGCWIGNRGIGGGNLPPCHLVFRSEAERKKWNRSEGARKQSARRWMNWGLTPPGKLACYANSGEGSSSGGSRRTLAPPIDNSKEEEEEAPSVPATTSSTTTRRRR